MFVHCPGMSEEVLRIAFSRFGEVQTLTMDTSKGCVESSVLCPCVLSCLCLCSRSFITFNNPSIASTAKKEVSC